MLWFQSALLPGGWARDVRIEVASGVIASVSAESPARSGDERHAIGLPGLPNLHSHAFQRGMAGLAEVRGPADDNFWTWRETMYRFLDRMGPDEMEAIAAQAYVEMLESGFTRVGEFHYLHHAPDGAPYADLAEMASQIAAAAASTGIGLTLLPVLYAHGGFGARPPASAQRRFINDVDAYARLLEASRRAASPLQDAVVGIAPHSLRAATIEQIAEVLPLAQGGPIHIHIAEQIREVEDCIAWSGRRPVALLFDSLPVDSRWCLVHATHVSEGERGRLATSGAVAGLCPITEANLGDGVFPAHAFAAEGGSFGVGSDSNVLIGAAEELRLLEYSQRLSLRRRSTLASAPGRSTGRSLFDSALEGGSRALGCAAEIATGAPADVVSLDAGNVALAQCRDDQWLDAWIFAGGQNVIDCVWRAGKKVVQQGHHRDREAIGESYRRAMARLLTG